MLYDLNILDLFYLLISLKSVLSQENWKVCENEQSQSVDSYEDNTQWHHYVTEIFQKVRVVFEEFFLSQGIQEVETPPD